jgi:carboxypeptidase Pfu. Metallo peptidase. MEROPS family M32
MINSETIKQILEQYRVVWALGHAQSVMGWDLETYMPEEGIKGRAVAGAEIAQLIQRFMLDEKFVKLIEKAEEERDLTDVERGIIRVLKRNLRFYQRVPPEVVKEFAKVTSEAFVAWRGAQGEGEVRPLRAVSREDSGADQGRGREAGLRGASLRRIAGPLRGGTYV